MMKTKLLHQSLELHGDLFLTAPHEEGKLLSPQSEGAGPPSVSGGDSWGASPGSLSSQSPALTEASPLVSAEQLPSRPSLLLSRTGKASHSKEER